MGPTDALTSSDAAPLHARYVPAHVLPAVIVTAVLLAAGVAAALAGVWIAWVVVVFMAWSLATLVRRMRRDDVVVTVDAHGVRDHRVPRAIAWLDVESMRTVDRRVFLRKIALLELVPRARLADDGALLARAVLRGDLAFVDARDRKRLMVDLHQLDTTPEAVLAAAREHRRAA